MARYIDAEKLNDEYYELFHHGTMAVKSVLSVFVDLLEKQPTADVIEVKHGHWIRIKRIDKDDVFRCSVCGIVAFDETETCLRCKSKMDGGKAE